MSLEDVALRSALLWLLLPGIGLPVCFLSWRKGHRGLFNRLLVWLLVIPLFLGASFLGGTTFLALLMSCAVLASWEIAGLLRSPPPFRIRLVAGLALAVSWPLLARFGPSWTVWPVTVLMFAAAGLFLHRRGRPGRWALPLLAILLGTSLSFWARLQLLPEGFRYVLVVFSVVVVADIVAFVCGRLLVGRLSLPARPFSRVSPHKTVAGYLGGAAGALMAAHLLRFAIEGQGLWQTTAVGMMLGAAGAAGDLLASLVKRRFEAKDFSRLLGSMGGVLDRLDSLLGAGWVYYLYLLAVGRVP